MPRLNADLILKSPQYFNAVRERELDLRGNKIAMIENLGATEDQFDSIDLSDNEIVKLEGFPVLKRLSTLIVNNNRIARISPTLGGVLPKLTTLVLTGNRLTNLTELEPLSSFFRLETLSLLDNTVAKKPNYRLFLIHKIPSLRILDFRKIKQKERDEAKKIFGSKEAEISAKKVSANTFVPGEIPETENISNGTEEKDKTATERKGPTPEQVTAIKAAIATAQTLEEVSRLEQALKSGKLPSDVIMADEDAPRKDENEAQETKETKETKETEDSVPESTVEADEDKTTEPEARPMEEG